MDVQERIRSDRYLKAKKRVDEIKGFYVHLIVYILVNLFISTMVIIGTIQGGDSLGSALSNFGVYAVWLFWGIGIFFHGLGVLGTSIIFGKNWEERKLQQYLEEYKEQSKRFLK